MSTAKSRQFDLEERTAALGNSAILLAKSVPLMPITRPLVSQLVRSATSVGANYCEADDAESRADFKHKIGICPFSSPSTQSSARPQHANEDSHLVILHFLFD